MFSFIRGRNFEKLYFHKGKFGSLFVELKGNSGLLESLLLLNVFHGELLGFRSNIGPNTDGGDSLTWKEGCFLFYFARKI